MTLDDLNRLEINRLEDVTASAPPTLTLWRERSDPTGYTDAGGAEWEIGRIAGQLVRRRSRHLTPADAFPTALTWPDIERVITQRPGLIRDVAWLQKRLAAGPMTLAQLLEWQRDKYDMRV